MVDFSIKRVPDDLAKRLRRRAERRQARERRTFTIADLHAFAAAQGLRTPAEATAWTRKERRSRGVSSS